MDDVTALMASLAEANRKKKLVTQVSESPLKFRNDLYVDNVNFSAPCFYFDQLMTAGEDFKDGYDLDNDDLLWTKLIKTSRTAFGEGKFRLPYEQCFYSHRPDNKVTTTSKFFVTYMYHLPNSNKVGMYTFSYHTTDLAFWSVFGSRIFLDKNYLNAEIGVQDLVQLNYNTVERHRYEQEMASSVTIAVSCNALLMQSHATTSAIQPVSSRAAAVNAGRARGKLKPLGDVIEIKLAPKPVEQPRDTKNVSTPKCPHDRRGTMVTKPAHFNKKGVWIEEKTYPRSSSAVKGGRKKGALYVVK